MPVSPSERTCDAIDCRYTGEPYDVMLTDKVNYRGIDMRVRSINYYVAYGCNKINKVHVNTTGNIGSNAFQGCSNLSSVEIKESGEIGSSAFADCSSLTKIVLDNKIKSIGEKVFNGCYRLKEFVIPDSVSIFNKNLFNFCLLLKSIYIHKGIREIKDSVFYNCMSLSKVVIEDRDTPLTLGSNSSNPLFNDCKLDSVYIGGKIVYNTSSSAGNSPFYRNTTLRSVKISDVETDIYDNEFYGCTNLQNVSIGDNVKSIGKWAFSGCGNLSRFDFGSGLQTIGQEAFSDCINITQISSEALVPPTCGTNALDDINKWTCKLIVPKTSIDAYKQANQWKEFFL